MSDDTTPPGNTSDPQREDFFLDPQPPSAKPARKTAKKTAKKATKKTAYAKADQPSDPPGQAPATDNFEPTPRPAASSESKKTNAPKTDAASSSPDEPQYGRVPGGGPVNSSPPSDQSAPSKQENPSNDSNQSAKQHHHDDQKPRQNRRDQNAPPHNQNRRRKKRKNRNRSNDQRDRQGNRDERDEDDRREVRPENLEGPKTKITGLLEIAPKGFGFIRLPEKKYEQAKDDAFVTPDLIRHHSLRPGVWIDGLTQEGPRGPQLVEVTAVNELAPDDARKLPAFEELKAVNPNKKLAFETTQDRYTTRIIDLVSPIGRGQRGLIVSPPRSGKTTLLLHVAEAVQELHEETVHLMVLLVDERPEEVTEFRRQLPEAEIYASSNDEPRRSHTRIAELCIERAKRLVEAGQHVFLLMDSITRLARAYNGNTRSKGRGVGSGGITVGALETPRRLFAAARNTREAGSLTILATALIQTNSRADDAIFQEFKGTGNMELVLDRRIAENYIYPAVDIFKSATRREELLLADHTLHKINMIRRGLAGHRPEEAMERLLFFLKKFPNNPQMLMEIKG